MPQFFISPSQIGIRGDGSRTVLITGDDALHITKSLRMKPGENVTVCDGCYREYLCRVESVGDAVVLGIESESRSKTEPPYRAAVYQALVKGDKIDTVIQKSVECGAARIVPFISERCVVRLSPRDTEKKLPRWQRIAEEAAKQCGRGTVPVVAPLMSFDEAVRDASSADMPLFCYENEHTESLASIIKKADGAPGSVSVMIGSEGGFSAKEADRAAECGMKNISLGSRILRTETASSFVLACLSLAFEM